MILLQVREYSKRDQANPFLAVSDEDGYDPRRENESDGNVSVQEMLDLHGEDLEVSSYYSMTPLFIELSVTSSPTQRFEQRRHFVPRRIYRVRVRLHPSHHR